MTIFEEKWSSYAKNEYNLFYQKLDAKHFHFFIIFLEKAVFSDETAKKCSGRICPFFREKGHFRQKINITFFIAN